LPKQDHAIRTQAELDALRAENGGYRRKLETTMQRLELAMQQACMSLETLFNPDPDPTVAVK